MYSTITKLPRPQTLLCIANPDCVYTMIPTYMQISLFSSCTGTILNHSNAEYFRKDRFLECFTHNHVFPLQQSYAFLWLTPVFLMHPKNHHQSFLDRHKDYITEFLDPTRPSFITVRELNQQLHQILQKSIGVSFEQVLNEALENISISFKSDGYSKSVMLPSCQQLNLVKVCPAFWDGVFFPPSLQFYLFIFWKIIFKTI